MPNVTYVVVLTRDTDRAAIALRSIAAQEPAADVLLSLHEVDDDMRALARSHPGARVIHDGVDLGIGIAWNLGLLAARAPRVAIVHEDAELLPGCTRQLLATMDARPDAGAVGPVDLRFDGTVLDAGCVLWADGASTRRTAVPAGTIAVDYLSSACLFLDREAAIRAGGFAERYFPATYVDLGMATALWDSGRTVLCDGRARAHHHTGAMIDPTRVRRSPRLKRFLLERNRARFREANVRTLAQQVIRRNEEDASHPDPDELVAADERAAAREAAVLAGAVTPVVVEPLAPLDDPEARAGRLRQELEDDFIEDLVASEAAMASELERVHLAYAELWADRERLRARTADRPG